MYYLTTCSSRFKSYCNLCCSWLCSMCKYCTYVLYIILSKDILVHSNHSIECGPKMAKKNLILMCNNGRLNPVKYVFVASLAFPQITLFNFPTLATSNICTYIIYILMCMQSSSQSREEGREILLLRRFSFYECVKTTSML